MKMTILRSYSRKLSHENYGGHKFEMSDLFSSYSSEVEVLDNGNDPINTSKVLSDLAKTLSESLFLMAKNDVEKAALEEIKRIKEETPPFEK